MVKGGKILNDVELIQGIIKGDQSALSQFYCQHHLVLFNFTNKLVDDRLISQEIVSETFLKFLTLRANFDNLNSIRAFMYVTCRNAAYDYLKYGEKGKRFKEADTDNFNDLLHLEIYDENILNDIIRAELLTEIYREITSLPAQQQRVVKMYYVDGLSHEEIATRLNMTPDNVRSTKRYGVGQLKVLMKQRKIITFLMPWLM